IGKLFGGSPKASATIGALGGDLGVIGVTGKRKLQGAAGDAGGSVVDLIDDLAEQLGAEVDASAGSVAIGIRKGKYRVDPSGRGQTKTKKGAIDFGEDSQAAIEAAVLDLINDGVIKGLSAAEQRLLKQGKSLQKALEDVLTFQSIFDRLQQ